MNKLKLSSQEISAIVNMYRKILMENEIDDYSAKLLEKIVYIAQFNSNLSELLNKADAEIMLKCEIETHASSGTLERINYRISQSQFNHSPLLGILETIEDQRIVKHSFSLKN